VTKRKTTEDFISECKNSNYDYSKVVYNTAYNKVIIICKIHGEFLQSPHAHLRVRNNSNMRSGCPTCANLVRGIKTGISKKYNIDIFIKKAVLIHGPTYIYDQSQYNGMTKNIDIECRIHGIFSQRAHSHIEGSGCPKCGLGNNSKAEKEWLDRYEIPEKCRQHYIKLNGKRIFVDGYDPESNTIYEFYGDFWHGNPTIHKSKDYNSLTKTTFGDLYNKTINREDALKLNGFNVISIWESDFKKDKNNDWN